MSYSDSEHRCWVAMQNITEILQMHAKTHEQMKDKLEEASRLLDDDFQKMQRRMHQHMSQKLEAVKCLLENDMQQMQVEMDLHMTQKLGEINRFLETDAQQIYLQMQQKLECVNGLLDESQPLSTMCC